MFIEWLAVPIGVICGAVVLFCVYILARRKAEKTGERPLIVFIRVLAVFMLFHGLGLALVTPCVWLGASTVFGLMPAEESGWMAYFTVVGVVIVLISGGVLCWTGLWPRAEQPPA
jgi:hypothetical protein